MVRLGDKWASVLVCESVCALYVCVPYVCVCIVRIGLSLEWVRLISLLVTIKIMYNKTCILIKSDFFALFGVERKRERNISMSSAIHCVQIKIILMPKEHILG